MDSERAYGERQEQRELFQNDTKWDLIQLRIDPDLKAEIMNYCRRKGLTLSCYTRMIYAKTLDNERTLHDPRQLQPINNAVDDVNRYLPVMKHSQYKHY